MSRASGGINGKFLFKGYSFSFVLRKCSRDGGDDYTAIYVYLIPMNNAVHVVNFIMCILLQ